MLRLKGEAPFAKGGHRECYRDPSDPGKCIKVMTGDWRTTRRRMRAPWIVRLCRPKWYFHDNLFEYRFLRKEERRVGKAAWDYIPRAYEIVKTDVGEGLIVDLINDEDGSISMTLVEYLWRNGMTEECQAAIDGMWEGVEKYRIFVQGRPDNVVIQQQKDGTCKCIAIDEFGIAQLIPLVKWSARAAAKKFRKYRERQERSVAQTLKAREENSKAPQKGFML